MVTHFFSIVQSIFDVIVWVVRFLPNKQYNYIKQNANQGKVGTARRKKRLFVLANSSSWTSNSAFILRILSCSLSKQKETRLYSSFTRIQMRCEAGRFSLLRKQNAWFVSIFQLKIRHIRFRINAPSHNIAVSFHSKIDTAYDVRVCHPTLAQTDQSFERS